MNSARCSRSAARENLLRRGMSREHDCRDDRGELERPEELRPEAGRLGARSEQLLLQPPERALVALADELYFELAEPLLDALALHDRHGVLDDLRAGGPQRLPPRAQARDARWLDAAKVHEEEREQLSRRLCGRARRLDLETRGTGRDLELPEPAALLGAVAQREPVSSEREVGRVEVASRRSRGSAARRLRDRSGETRRRRRA